MVTSTCEVNREKGLIENFKVASNLFKRLRVSILILVRDINAPVLALCCGRFLHV